MGFAVLRPARDITSSAERSLPSNSQSARNTSACAFGNNGVWQQRGQVHFLTVWLQPYK